MRRIPTPVLLSAVMALTACGASTTPVQQAPPQPPAVHQSASVPGATSGSTGISPAAPLWEEEEAPEPGGNEIQTCFRRVVAELSKALPDGPGRRQKAEMDRALSGLGPPVLQPSDDPKFSDTLYGPNGEVGTISTPDRVFSVDVICRGKIGSLEERDELVRTIQGYLEHYRAGAVARNLKTEPGLRIVQLGVDGPRRFHAPSAEVWVYRDGQGGIKLTWLSEGQRVLGPDEFAGPNSPDGLATCLADGIAGLHEGTSNSSWSNWSRDAMLAVDSGMIPADLDWALGPRQSGEGSASQGVWIKDGQSIRVSFSTRMIHLRCRVPADQQLQDALALLTPYAKLYGATEEISGWEAPGGAKPGWSARWDRVNGETWLVLTWAMSSATFTAPTVHPWPR